MALYRTGTAAMDAQGVITGTGTKWKEPLSLIRTGATIVFLTSPLKLAVISDIVSNTEMRAIQTDGEAVNNGQYVILLNDSLTVDGMAQDVAETLRYYQSKETVIEEAIEFFKNYDLATLQKIAAQVTADAASANKAKTDAQSAQKAAETAKNQANTIKNDTQKIKDSAVTEITAIKTEALDARDAAEDAQFAAEESAANAKQHKVDAQTAEAEAEKWAKVAQDAAGQAQEPYKNVIQPFPDVWIPFNDSLDMLAGFAPGYKQITVGDDVINMPSDKVVNFKRASGATYINKSGVLTVAEIDEPRFEKEGLLIEGQRTNYMLNSEDPASWGRSSNMNVPETGTDDFGFTYGKFVCNDSLIGQTSAINMASIAATKSVDVSGDNKYATTSCRFKTELGVRVRIRFDKYDGSATTFLGDAYIDAKTLEIKKTGGAASRITARVKKDDATGWIFAEATIEAIDGELNIGSQIQYAPKEGGSTVSGDYIYLATPQVENGSSASSFIISGTTATTRASDMVTIPTKNNIYTQPVSILVEVNKTWNIVPNGAPRIMDLNATSSFAEESFIFAFRGQTSTVLPGSAYVSVGSPAKSTGTSKVVTSGVYGVKIDKGGLLSASLNGDFSSKTQTSWGGAVKSTSIRIGGQTTAGSRHLFGHVRNFRIWHKELTDVQMSEAV